MTQDREQQSHQQHQEESWPLFMSREQREQLIQKKFARNIPHFKFHGEKHVRSNPTGNILQNR